MEGVYQQYYRQVQALLDRVYQSQQSTLTRAARLVADALAGGGLLFVTGSGHSHMIAEEVFYRAGGLVAVHPILTAPLMLHEGALRSSELQRQPGLAQKILDYESVSGGDVLVVASHSGRNAYPVEMALAGRKRGAKVIALTSMGHSAKESSRYSDEKYLYQLADVVLDNCGPSGDAAVRMPGVGVAMGPTSTITGVFLIQSMVLMATEMLLQRGKKPELFENAHMEQPHSEAIDLGPWKKRIRFL